MYWVRNSRTFSSEEICGVGKRHSYWLIIGLAILLLAGLLASRTEKLPEKVWTVELVGGCALDYHASERVLALACPRVDYIRLWPLPVTQPWEEPEKPPRPQHGQMARVRTWTQIGSSSCRLIYRGRVS